MIPRRRDPLRGGPLSSPLGDVRSGSSSAQPERAGVGAPASPSPPSSARPRSGHRLRRNPIPGIGLGLCRGFPRRGVGEEVGQRRRRWPSRLRRRGPALPPSSTLFFFKRRRR